MKPVSDLFPYIMPRVPGCSEPLAQQAVVDAAIAFCDESMVLRERLDPITTQPGEADYELDTPPQTRLSRVLRVQLDGVGLTALPATMLPAHAMDMLPGDKPLAFCVSRRDESFLLTLLPPPTAEFKLDIEVALAPSAGATRLPDDLVSRWRQALVYGALARLHDVPGQPFTDPVSASAATAQYLSQVKRARVESNVGHVRASVSVKMRSF